MESNANSRRKRVRTGKDVDVEKALVEWVKMPDNKTYQFPDQYSQKKRNIWPHK